MHNALRNDTYNEINSNNYNIYIDSIVASGEGHIYRKKYYAVDSIDTWNKITDTYEYELKNYMPDWYDVYKTFTDKEKQKASEMYETLGWTVFGTSDIPNTIQNWSITEFFMNLGILNHYEYAIVAIDMDRYTNNSDMFDAVEQYPLSAAQKSLILYLIGGYDWNDIHKDNKEDIFDYFDEKYDTKDMGAILEMLGYEVEYKDDGLTAYW